MHQSLATLQQELLAKRISIRDVLSYYFTQIRMNSDKRAFLRTFEEDAENYIQYINSKIQSNPSQLGKLFGCVVSIKDNICYKDHESKAGSKILEGYISPYNATVVQRLIDEDAFIIGSTNCDEFGMGSESKNPHYGSVVNGFGNNLIAGGSSGGSAVAVQMNMCMVSLGSDTGGSIRQPAALCNVFGFKPSYGHVSRYGLIAYASSFDQIGIISQDVDNIQLVYSIIKGADGIDSTCNLPTISTNTDKKKSEITLAYVNPKVKSPIVDDYLATIKELGNLYQLTEVDLPLQDSIIPCYYILTTAEASSNLNRYDGVRYGQRAQEFSNLNEMYINTRTEGFGAEVKKRILLGTFVLSEGYFDAYYIQAQKVRRLIVEKVDSIFDKFDYLITPTVIEGPWSLNDTFQDPLKVYQSDMYTALSNLVGCPAVNLALKSNKFISKNAHIQVMVNKGQDELLLESNFWHDLC